MKYVNPMEETPEGRLLAICKSIEISLGIEKDEKNYECMGSGCSDDDCPDCGKVVKYHQESTADNGVPQFHEVSGENIRAAGFGTNQTLPFSEDGPSRKPISEVAKMPAVSQTGYDAKSSSLHMHLTNPGGFNDNKDSVEDYLGQIRKSSHPSQFGVVDEIAGLIHQIYARL